MPPKSKSLPKREYFSLSEIAKMYGVKRPAVWRMMDRKKVPHEMIGNLIVIKRKNLPLLGYKG